MRGEITLCAALAAAGIATSWAADSPAKVDAAPPSEATLGSSSAMPLGPSTCSNVSTGLCAGQIGIQGGFDNDCDLGNPPGPDDDAWNGLGFPIVTGGAQIDSLTFTLNTNRAGGHIYIVSNASTGCEEDLDGDGEVSASDLAILLGAWGTDPGGPPDFNGDGDVDASDLAVLLGAWGPCAPAGDLCQPDVTNVLRQLCCPLEGLETEVEHTLTFDPIATSDVEPTWVLFVGRTGSAGEDPDTGLPDGSAFPAHQVARDDTAPSKPGVAFGNLSNSGNPGDWTDLHDFDLGTPYCVELSMTGNEPIDPDQCDEVPIGACCAINGDCTEGLDWECGVAGGFYQGDGTSCLGPTECPVLCPDSDNGCFVPSPDNTPGCDDPDCCIPVCESDPFCCEVEWDQNCAETARTVCLAIFVLATGDDDSVDGYLDVGPDEFGSWASAGFGGNGDHYNPAGSDDVSEAAFTSGLFFFRNDGGGGPSEPQRELLSDNESWQGVGDFGGDETLERTITMPFDFDTNPPEDTNDDGVADTAHSAFDVTGGNTNVSFELTQTVAQVPGANGTTIATITQTYTITNNSSTPIEFELLHLYDGDHLWQGDAADDHVGTSTNNNKGLDRFVYLSDGSQVTAVTTSSPQGDGYWGGKGGLDPDGKKGPGPPFGFGTDTQWWEAFGIPEGWRNHIAGVGSDADGDSGPTPEPENCSPCDAETGLEIPISLGPAESTVVEVQLTYGATTPEGG